MDPKKAKSIFLHAVEHVCPSEWPSYLDNACGDDASLRHGVELLLAAHQENVDLAEQARQACNDALPTIDQPPLEKLGSQIGPYKLLQQIGEGGFGVVYMAEQTQPVRRKVALKVIKPGMDTNEVIARFEAERQALALMDHPNIARVYDAGATDSGRPYFVMELVKGVPLTEYCDKNHLSGRDRLKLFIDVCHAVQHAHQKGVIHRDLKPSNIMVTLHDGKPVPKVIDFGVSKALSQQLTEKTLFTAYGQMVGTPAYMSPEQAEMSGLDIDTRSDVYSLGVLLYELLTGSTPFDAKRLRTAGYAEIQRIIREEEPPKPSTRLSTLGEQSSIVSSNRGTDPKKLGQLVRGDLDWIVMKALDKERNRRYETANGFAADVERFLNDVPVEACPPSAGYKFRKFARRNKAPLAVAAGAALALIVVAAGSLIAAGGFRSLARRNADLVVEKDRALTTTIAAEATAKRSRDQEQELREEAQRQTQIAKQQRERAEANFALARSAVDQFLNQVTANELLTVPGLQPLRQELLASAMQFYEKFTKDEANAAELLFELAAAHYRIAVIRGELGQRQESIASNARSIELFEQLRERGNESLGVRLGLAKLYFRAARYNDTVALCQAILDTNPEHADTRSILAEAYNTLAVADKTGNDVAGSLTYHQQALALREGLAQDFPDNPKYLAELGGTINNLGVLLSKQNQTGEALQMFERGADSSARAYELAPHSILWGRWLAKGVQNVAGMQVQIGDQQAALRSYQRLVDVRRKLAFENPAVTWLRSDLYRAYLALGRYERQLGQTAEANRSFREARNVLENIPHETPAQLSELALVYASLSQPLTGTVQEDPFEADEQARFSNQAVATLKQAVQAGYRNLSALEKDKLLDPLRERDDFREVLASLQKVIEAEKLAQTAGGTSKQKLADRRQAVDLLKDLVQDEPSAVRQRATLAATLQAMAVIQSGLKQYPEARKSLDEALRLSEQLRTERPDDLISTHRWLATRILIGQLCWDQGEYAEAHRRWQACLAETLHLAEAHRDDKSLQKALGDVERTIFERYGSYGLLPLVREFVARNVEFRRVTAVDSGGFVTDGEFSAVVLAPDDRDLAQRFFHQFAEAVRTSKNPSLQFELIQLARGAGALGENSLLSDAVLTRIRKTVDENKTLGWMAVAVAIVQFRAGQYVEAQTTLAPLAQDDPQVAFLNAAIAWKLGDQEQSRLRWADAESRYRELCRDALARDWANRKVGVFNRDWWQFPYDQAMRRLAAEVMSDGQRPGDDPWQRLIQARGYRLIGEIETSDAELAAAVAAAPSDADIWLARAELFDQWDEQKRSASDWQKAVELAADNPRPWIHRGRWYAQRGEQQQADADFARAAALTNQLNPFLEAGWWIAGPIAGQISAQQGQPSEADLALDRPVLAADGKTTFPWRQVPTGDFGLVDVSSASGAGTNYAIGFLFCDRPRQETLLLTGHGKARVWLNGQEIGHSDRLSESEFAGLTRLGVTLQPGRNMVLVKHWPHQPTDKTHAFYLRFPEGDLDRGTDYLRSGLFAEAAELLDRGLEFPPPISNNPWYSAVQAMRAADVEESRYRSLCRRILARYGDTSHVHGARVIGLAGGLTPETVVPHDQLVRMAELHFTFDPKDSNRVHVLAMALYRAGKCEQARDRLLADGKTETDQIRWSLLSLIYEQLGDHETASYWLGRARQWYDQNLDALAVGTQQPSWRWPEFLTLLREAASVIEGRPLPDDARLHLWRARSWLGFGDTYKAVAELTAAGQLAPNDPDAWLASMVNLANSFAAQGRHSAASIELHEQILVLQRAKHGPDHANTLSTMHHLANGYAQFDRHEEALQLREESLKLRTAKLGRLHGNTVSSLYRLSLSYTDVGRYAEAKELLEEALAHAKADAPPQTNAIMKCSYQLACVLAITLPQATENEEQAERAVTCLREAVAAGFVDAAGLKQNKLLASLRDREDFQMLLTELEAPRATEKKP